MGDSQACPKLLWSARILLETPRTPPNFRNIELLCSLGALTLPGTVLVLTPLRFSSVRSEQVYD